MAALLINPQLQFVDNNGAPYAGGYLYSYVEGTSTPKTTWADDQAQTANPNPLTLDERGTTVCFGDGSYRLVLTDVNGVQIFDATSSTVVSDNMTAFMQATDMATARSLLGAAAATDLTAEVTRATNAEGTLNTAISNEVTRAEGAEGTLTTDLNNEIARAEAAEANLQSQISGGSATSLTKGGQATSNAGGAFTVTYPTAFPAGTDSVVCCAIGSSWWANVTSVSASGFSGTTSSPLEGGSWVGGPAAFYWISIGH